MAVDRRARARSARRLHRHPRRTLGLSRQDQPLAHRSGDRETDATRYVASVFGGLSGSLLSAQPTDFGTLADEYATAGGINEQFLAALSARGASRSSSTRSTRSPIASRAGERARRPWSVPEVLEPLGVAALGLAAADADQVEAVRARPRTSGPPKERRAARPTLTSSTISSSSLARPEPATTT